MNSLDLNEPPTAVGGIKESLIDDLSRKDLNHPPTAMGGIRDFLCKAEAIALDVGQETVTCAC